MKRLLLLLALLLWAAPAQALTLTVNLNAGWNSVAVQGTHVTAVNGTNVAGMAYFDGTAYQIQPLTPDAINDGLGTFRGFWVFCTGTSGTLTYTADEGTATYTLRLKAGWNLVAFPSSQNVTGARLFPYLNGQAVPLGSIILPQTYRVLLDGQQVLVDISNATATLLAGRPYWIYAAQVCELGFIPGQP